MQFALNDRRPHLLTRRIVSRDAFCLSLLATLSHTLDVWHSLVRRGNNLDTMFYLLRSSGLFRFDSDGLWHSKTYCNDLRNATQYLEMKTISFYCWVCGQKVLSTKWEIRTMRGHPLNGDNVCAWNRCESSEIYKRVTITWHFQEIYFSTDFSPNSKLKRNEMNNNTQVVISKCHSSQHWISCIYCAHSIQTPSTTW